MLNRYNEKTNNKGNLIIIERQIYEEIKCKIMIFRIGREEWRERERERNRLKIE